MRRIKPFLRYAPVILAAFWAAACSASVSRPATASAHTVPHRTWTGKPRPVFGHVAVIVFENKEYDQVIGNSAAPNFNRLARRFALLTNYFGVAHPSLPNYLALVSGSTQGITSDCTSCAVDARNLADTLEAAGRSWKTYAEGLPSPGFAGVEHGRYVKKHVPFLYFRDVLSDPGRLARIVPLSHLSRDLTARALPDLAFIVPDQCHDMHDCPVGVGDRWLRDFLPRLLANRQFKRDGVVFTVFDEGETNDHAWGGGHTLALALGPVVRPGSRSSVRLDHYSLLRTIEDAWSLPRLERSETASPILGIWR